MYITREARQLASFVGAVAAIPRFAARLDMFSFKLNLPHMMMGICDGAAVITQAAEQVMNSKGLALVLRQVLAIGNIMNEGSRKGQASGECGTCKPHLRLKKNSNPPMYSHLRRHHLGVAAQAHPDQGR